MVGLGGNNFGPRLDADDTAKVVHAAIDAGITFIDTADLYGDGLSEEYLGAALAGVRDEVIVATKFGMAKPPETLTGPRLTGGDPAWVRQAVDASLRRLGTDWIDLYLLHQPDPAVTLADTLGALHELVAAGKVREIGCSNFDAELAAEAAAIADEIEATPFRCIQNRYSVLHREPEAEVLPWCEQSGTAFVPFYPLESGLLTGKVTGAGDPVPGTRLAAMTPERRAGFLSDSRLAAALRLQDYARSRDRTLLELACAYLLAQPPLASIIAGAMTVEQVAANAAAVDWRLTPDEVEEIREVAGSAGGSRTER